ncbi:MAG TPA: hypothetical protein VGG33_25135 [Polyangia bacterium]
MIKNNVVAVITNTGLILTTATTGLACGDDAAAGRLEVRVYGEEFIESGIPADVFEDGWKVSFRRFLVALSDVSAARGAAAPALTWEGQAVYDLARPTTGTGSPPGTLVTAKIVDGGVYDRVGYSIKPAGPGALAGPSVDPAAVAAMASAGESMRVEGTGEKAGARIGFSWGFATNVRHRDCQGSAKVDGGEAKTEITIHGDHLFYDDLFAAAPNVSFGLIAASDQNGDGQVTKDELTAKDITGERRYQVGSEAITNLWAFVARQATTVGHIDGEGHCQIEPGGAR